MQMEDNNNPDHLHVLIVDDEESLRNTLQQMVNRAGYACSTSPDGKQALAILNNRKVDVVITDIRMEGMDGIELLKQIKDKHDADVIVMTGFTEDYAYEEIIASGASDFALKPFSAGELTVRLKRVLRERSLKAEMSKTQKELESSHKVLVRTLVSLIEEKDLLMKGHAERVASNCVHFSRKLGFTKNVIEKLFFAGLLHDLGKIYLPRRLLMDAKLNAIGGGRKTSRQAVQVIPQILIYIIHGVSFLSLMVN